MTLVQKLDVDRFIYASIIVYILWQWYVFPEEWRGISVVYIVVYMMHVDQHYDKKVYWIE